MKLIHTLFEHLNEQKPTIHEHYRIWGFASLGGVMGFGCHPRFLDARNGKMALKAVTIPWTTCEEVEASILVPKSNYFISMAVIDIEHPDLKEHLSTAMRSDIALLVIGVANEADLPRYLDTIHAAARTNTIAVITRSA